MKTKLPSNSESHKSRINEITQNILKAGTNKIAFIILFGSFARGNWIFDRYEEDGIIYQYASDYDFLIITKARRADDKEGISSFDLERRISNEIYKNELVRHNHNAHFVIESIDYVNSQLEKGGYFFSDIKKEGILLYDSKEFQLAEPKILSEKEVREIAREDYKHWFEIAENFMKHTEYGVSDNSYKIAAFNLHQAAESLYNCALLVLTGYKPKSHELKELNSLCAAESNDFLSIFPLATEEQKNCFKLLQKAYIDARYNKHYIIEKAQLEYLIKRVEKLKQVVEKVCKNKI